MYLQILTNVNILVHTAIRHSDLDWRLKHTCPACMYTLTSEVPLKFRMLYMKDGNDSLKRVLKQCIGDNDLDSDDPIPSAQCSSELPTTQFVGGDWYLSREYIDQFTDLPVNLLAADDEVSFAFSLLILRTTHVLVIGRT